jgi:hypothetical protein
MGKEMSRMTKGGVEARALAKPVDEGRSGPLSGPAQRARLVLHLWAIAFLLTVIVKAALD